MWRCSGTLGAFQEELQEVTTEVRLLDWNADNEGKGLGRGRANNGTKWKIAEPHTYYDVQDAKELDNSIFDNGKPENWEKKDCYVLYLIGDGKLWRTKYANIEKGGIRIDTWDDLKKDMKLSMLSSMRDETWDASNKLRQSGSMS